MSDKKSFATLLYELSQKLSDVDKAAIIFIEKLPESLKKEQKLEVLIRLQMDGKISESDPATLQAVFRNINRMDLVSRVKDYMKFHKKKEKKAQKSGILSHQMENVVSDLDANLKVSLIQAKVLKEQLLNVASIAAKCGDEKLARRIQQSIDMLYSEVERPIISALDVDMAKDSCSSTESISSDNSPDSTLNYHVGTYEIITQESANESEQIVHCPKQEEAEESYDYVVYEVATDTPQPVEDHYCPVADLYEPIMATPIDDLPKNTLKRSSNTVRSSDKPSFEGSRKKLDRQLDRPMLPPKLKFEATEVDKDGSISIDDCSDRRSRSDSGFSESCNFKRPVPLPRYSSLHHNTNTDTAKRPIPIPRRASPPSSTGYAKLNTEQVQVPYYKLTTREINEKCHDIVSGKLGEASIKEEDGTTH